LCYFLFVGNPDLIGITGIDGTGRLAIDLSGSAEWLMIPCADDIFSALAMPYPVFITMTANVNGMIGSVSGVKGSSPLTYFS
jgi:hypothetical protein